MKLSPKSLRLLRTKLPTGAWMIEYCSSTDPYTWHASSLGGQIRRTLGLPSSQLTNSQLYVHDSTPGWCVNLPCGLNLLIRYTMSNSMKYRLRNVRTGEILSYLILEPRRLLHRPADIQLDDDEFWEGGIVL